MGFQNRVNRVIPLGVAGDFASVNPYASMLVGEGALRTAEPITVGKFAFADIDTGLVTQKYTDGQRAGFVHRNLQATIGYGEEASMSIMVGVQCTLHTAGDFYTVFKEAVTLGQKVGANKTDGEPVAGDTVPETAIPVNFTVAQNAKAGELCRITTLG